MPTPTQIESALAKVTDQKSFIQTLLIDTLGWPIDPDAKDVETVTYAWSAEDLRAAGIDKKIAEGTIRQIPPAEGCPWGIFLVEFTSEAPFADAAAGRGMTDTLRRILRGLVPSKRKDSKLASFSREHLLFICTHKYRHFRFAYFKDPGEAFKTPPLISFGWTPGGAVKTVSKYNLPHLEWPTAGTSGADWLAEWTQAFDVERVTKKFFTEFADQHKAFLKHVHGIAGEGGEQDRRWYVSALLNRLMFVYFLQKRGFIDGGRTDYLEAKLAECRQKGEDRFFEHFLKPLFFEGFAKPEEARSDAAKSVLGKIRYLNGGLFLRHPVEQKHPVVTVTDSPFESLFDLFAYYSWNLDDTPGGSDNEINPDVLGYIFEKYINQKEFGAYYTRPEITDYLCEKTIHRLILEAVNTPRDLPAVPGVPVRNFATVGDLIAGLDSRLATRLLDEILPGLSLLDPACGSGAFLIAALKAMIDVYKGVFAWIEFHGSAALKDRLKSIRKDHPSLAYFIKKQIITKNLYGVDLMDEATEIARLRLFLALVASADKVEDLEPLPNIDFNVLAGNSLIGLIKVDEGDFDTRGHEANIFAGHYRDILAKKNRLTGSYRDAATYSEQLTGLRDDIRKHNEDAVGVLNDLLLAEFHALGVKYHEIGWNDNAQDAVVKSRRSVLPRDVAALKPFHWAYVFDEIMVQRGGFDAIITNPPWEVFKPNSKEFFENHSELVSKKKMTIHAFEEHQATLLKDAELRKAWIAYLEQFPYVSAYFRATEQYRNQISIVDGKKVGTDVNLYKLFLERCFRLLRLGGYCGILVSSGIYNDLGSKQLRAMLVAEARCDRFLGLSNERGLFEGVHHDHKFMILTFQRGGTTPIIRMKARYAVTEAIAPPELRDFLRRDDDIVLIPIELLRRFAPESLSAPDFRSPTDIRIAERMFASPTIRDQSAGEWRLTLCNEFHMTGDSDLYIARPGPGRIPLIEGKCIHQYDHQWERPRYWVSEEKGRARLLASRKRAIGKAAGVHQVRVRSEDPPLDYEEYRLGFRDVGTATNERSMIMAVLPRRIFCPHTMSLEQVFVEDVRDGAIDPSVRGLTPQARLFLLGVFNSFVVDWWLKKLVSKHISFFYVYQLPVPRRPMSDAGVTAIVDRAARLTCTTPEFDDLANQVGLGSHTNGVTDPAQRAKLRAELDGVVAHLYGLTEAEFAHVLQAFPLVDKSTKDAALDAYRAQAARHERTSEAAHAVEKLIAAGESATVEFKETARWDVKLSKGPEKYMEDVIVKTIAAMLNTEGGTLVIGVSDDGQVQGLARDYSTLDKRPNKDGFEQWLVSRLNTDLGKDITPTLHIQFAAIDGKEVCSVKVRPAPRPVFVEKEGKEGKEGQEKFYVRSGGTTNELKPSDMAKYQRTRWPEPKS